MKELLPAHKRGDLFYDSNHKPLYIGARVEFKIHDRGAGGVGTGVIAEKQHFLKYGQVIIKRDVKWANDTHATFHYDSTNVGYIREGFYEIKTTYITIID